MPEAKSIMGISVAESLGFHAMAFLASNHGRIVKVKEITEKFGVSFHHLRKVMLRLEKEGLVIATQGPRGGYKLARPPSKISLLEIFEAIEGKFPSSNCIFGNKICRGNGCIFGDFFVRTREDFRRYLENTTISKFAEIFKDGRESIENKEENV